MAAQRTALRNQDKHWCEELSVSKVGFGVNIQSLVGMCYKRDSFNNDLIARDPDHDVNSLKINQVVEEEFGMGQIMNPLMKDLSSLATRLFLPVFRNLHITRWVNTNDFLITVKNAQAISTAPYATVFQAVPSVDKKPSSVNFAGSEEFNHDKSYNVKFWNDHIQFRNNTEGRKTLWMDIAIRFPTCFMTNSQKLEHFNARDTFNTIGPHLGGNYYQMTLYGGYCGAFSSFNSCQLTLHARAMGYRPLFCMTNVLCQRSTWGVIDL